MTADDRSTTDPTLDFLCVGAATWDIIFAVDEVPRAPVKVLANECLEVASGMATSAAIAIATLGGSVRIRSRVGDDALGQRYKQAVDGRGVDTSLVETVAQARTALSTIIVGSDGERLICPYYDPALYHPPPAAVHRDANTHVLVDMRWPAQAEAVLSAGGEHYRVLDADIAPREHYAGLVAGATHTLFSQEGLRIFADTAHIGRGLRFAAERTDGVVGVTLGAEGAVILERQALQHYPGLSVDAVDTLAAGDVFHGAFLFQIAQTHDVAAAVRFANTAAALKCTTFGGNLGAPTLGAVESRWRDAPSARGWRES
ncbi:MAG: PfkB family carbohydrate kinase [Pseudomonadota bacterium]